jgi:hypothetical protein
MRLNLLLKKEVTNMSLFKSKLEFACEIFGYENAIAMNTKIVDNYFEDWKNTKLSINQYKKLLQTRG